MGRKKAGVKRPNPSAEVENKSQEIILDSTSEHGSHRSIVITPATLKEVSKSVLGSSLPGEIEMVHIVSADSENLDDIVRRSVRRRVTSDPADIDAALASILGGAKGNHRVPASVTASSYVGNINMNSVVKVFCVHTEPNFSLPWQRRRQCASTGSGFLISGRRILTNAHCVEHHTQVKVNRRGSDKKFLASVLAIGTECDLAMLTVEDEEFWELSEPLEFGQLPHLQDAVTVVGYPIGGDTMSVSSGVVSRIEVTPYSHGAMELLAVQIDAAINPGNSGGPAFNDEGKCVGVAFQSLKHEDAENIGYIIPATVVEHFIADYERNGRYTGFPILGVEWQKTENVDLRRYLKMDDSMKGVMIRRVEPTSPASQFLQQDDVLLSFDGIVVSNDGTVPFRGSERISFSYLISTKYPGDSVRIEVLKKGEKKEFTVILEMPYKLIPFHIKGLPPTYFIIAGFVFTTLTVPYLRSEYGQEYEFDAPLKLLQKMAHKMADTKGQQVVVLSQVLAAEVNIGYEDLHNTEVRTFNGEKVINMEHFVHLVDAAIKRGIEVAEEEEKKEDGGKEGRGEGEGKNEEIYLSFGLDYNIKVALSAKKAKKSTADILALHCIPSDRSNDLLALTSSSSSSSLASASEQAVASEVAVVPIMEGEEKKSNNNDNDNASSVAVVPLVAKPADIVVGVAQVETIPSAAVSPKQLKHLQKIQQEQQQKQQQKELKQQQYQLKLQQQREQKLEQQKRKQEDQGNASNQTSNDNNNDNNNTGGKENKRRKKGNQQAEQSNENAAVVAAIPDSNEVKNTPSLSPSDVPANEAPASNAVTPAAAAAPVNAAATAQVASKEEAPATPSSNKKDSGNQGGGKKGKNKNKSNNQKKEDATPINKVEASTPLAPTSTA